MRPVIFSLVLPLLSSLADVTTDAVHGGRRTFAAQRDSAYEYLSGVPGLPDARLTGGCSCRFIISSRNHLGVGEAAEETQYTCSIKLGFTQDSVSHA